jgi:hypothetical protein
VELSLRVAVLIAGGLLFSVVRAALRRPVLHPWLLAFALGAGSAVLSERSVALSAPAEHTLYAAACFVGFLVVFAFAEGLRWEIGTPTTSRGWIPPLCLALAVAVLCAFVPTPRDRIIGSTFGAAYLLTLLPTLLRPRSHRIGSFVLAAGIVIYALGRTVLVVLQVQHGPVTVVDEPLDVASIVVLGLGLLIFSVEAVVAAVGSRPSAA